MTDFDQQGAALYEKLRRMFHGQDVEVIGYVLAWVVNGPGAQAALIREVFVKRSLEMRDTAKEDEKYVSAAEVKA